MSPSKLAKLSEMSDEEFLSELECLLRLPSSTREKAQLLDRISKIQGNIYERANQIYERLNRQS